MKRFMRTTLCLILCAVFCAGLIPAGSAAAPAAGTVALEGAMDDNAGDNNYTRRASPIRSYLAEEKDGGYVRAFYTDQFDLKVDWFSADGKRTKSVTVAPELPRFGGFFFGKTYNFAVTGASNPNDDPTAEVLRVVRYDKNMNRLDAISFYGENTNIPFAAGSLRFLEYGGLLYIYSCHTMYADPNGINHQANFTLVLQQAPLKRVDSFFGVANIKYCGYVSHSFNQFIATDGQTLYRADHGDAHMRGVCVTAANLGDELMHNIYTVPLPFAGEIGNNTTGATLGGMTVCGNRLLLAGSIDSQTHEYSQIYWEDPYQMNIFVLSLSKDLDEDETRRVNLTAYPDDADVNVGTPHLVPLANDSVMILWEEETGGVTVVKAGILDGYGKLKNGIHTLEARLSDCAPQLSSDGCVYWFATRNGKSLVYRIDPADIDSFVPADHAWQTKVIKAPTCEEGGKADLICAVCGKTRKNVTLPATGHDWSGWQFAYDDTSHRRVCRNDQNHVEWQPHDWETVSVEQEATCFSPGRGERHCAGCGVTESGTIFPALGHDWGAWTYRDEETHVRVCGRDRSHTEKGNHSWDAGVVIKKATARQDGSIRYTCAVCGGTRTEKIPKTGEPAPVAFIPGDVNGDTQITAADARLALRCAVGLESYKPGSRAFLAANVNGDADVTAADARLILRAAVGLETLK